MLGAERKRLAQVAIEVGGALAGDPVQQVERDVVKIGITKMVEGATDGIRTGAAFQHLEQRGLEALRSERYAGDAASAQQVRELGSHCLRVRLDGHLLRGRKAREQPLELRSVGEGRSPAAEEDRLELRGERTALELELGEKRVYIGRLLAAAADDGDEVAVAAAVRAERKMHVQVSGAAAHFLFVPSRLRTARNASCGTSTAPTCFIRFLPAFWRSSSLRLRVMSPP